MSHFERAFVVVMVAATVCVSGGLAMMSFAWYLGKTCGWLGDEVFLWQDRSIISCGIGIGLMLIARILHLVMDGAKK